MSTSDLLGTKMLLATDGSEEAELATRAAVELANSTRSDLHLVQDQDTFWAMDREAL